MAKKNLTNADFLNMLNKQADYNNPMIWAMVNQGIGTLIDSVISNEKELLAEEKIKEAEGRIPLISMDLWVKTAKDIKKIYDEVYNNKPTLKELGNA